jgi:U6 snRNA-associated Sm-like protein LSm1
MVDTATEKVDVLLRDEKEYIGILRSYDQFGTRLPYPSPLTPILTPPANLVLTECYERIAARNPSFGSTPTEPAWLVHDVKLPGLMTIRGENVTICATVDLDREDTPRGVKFAPVEQVRSLAAQQKADKKDAESRKAKALRQAGIEPGFGMAA